MSRDPGIAVDNPALVLVRELRGNATVAIVAYGSPTISIKFNNTLIVSPYPTHSPPRPPRFQHRVCG